MESQALDLETSESSESLYKDNGTLKGHYLIEISGPLPHINEKIELSINDTFPNWAIAEHYIAQYGYQKGFVAIKVCNRTDKNGRLTNLYYKCEFGGTYQPKKTVNLQNQHNKDTRIFASINRQFSNECHEDIRYLVVNGRCDLSTIRSFLSAKYPDQPFFTRDLANVVAQLQREYRVKRNDASLLLTKLYEYKEIDPNWYIKPLIDPISNRLRGIFWMDPGQRERWIRFFDNYNKTRIAAQALMPDETIESFQW
ncbi:1691_t:CDS:2, partial [Scutellospora calospora]